MRRYSRGVTFGPRLSVAERSSSERRGVVNDQVGSRVPVFAMANGIWDDGDVGGGGLGIGTRVPSEVLGSLYISGSRRIPRPSASSESEPHWCCMTVFLRKKDLSMLSVTEAEPWARLYFSFLTPRSRTKEPITRTFETAVAARISKEARRERYGWEPLCSITEGTR